MIDRFAIVTVGRDDQRALQETAGYSGLLFHLFAVIPASSSICGSTKTATTVEQLDTIVSHDLVSVW
ncbi:hypothetical protein DMJ13_25810 [halophilic archaeon]|nr:hypothetical protein DMJ13_25810 [halophilic archaeon]